jgi:outer membrane protein assembly factor BamB
MKKLLISTFAAAVVCSSALWQELKPGDKIWSLRTGSAVYSSPSVGGDDTIYIGSWDNYLHAIKPDGKRKWRFKTSGQVRSSAAIGSDGTIYVGSDDANLYAINPDGSKKWAFRARDYVRSSPAIGSDGTIYVGSDDGYLYAIKTSTDNPVEAQPAEIAIDTYAGVMIEGTVGAKYRVEFKDKLDDAAKWIVGDVIELPESPYLWVDRFKPIRETRYYRVILVE